ncbi:MAG: sensor histidine kinase [Flavipsychrobacter sp.]
MLFAIFVILYIVVQKRKQVRHILEKERMKHQFSSELLQSKLEVQEQTSQNLSEEIHDNVGQLLSLAKINIHNIEKHAENDRAKNHAEKSKELLTKAISDLRTISHTLNGNYVLQMGLAESIQKEVGYVSSAKEINCNFNINGEQYSLGEDKELLIFRIIQESIANAIKHGDPENITVALDYQPETLLVTITDDGSGFETDVKKEGSGIGLNNIKVRTELLRGKVDISSTQNKGTVITLSIPFIHEKNNTSSLSR